MNEHTYTVTYRNDDSEDVQAVRVDENDTSYVLYGSDGTPALVAPRDIVRSIRKHN